MGNSISAQVEQLENKQMQTEVKDQLDFMVKAATAKLDGYQVELEEYVDNPLLLCGLVSDTVPLRMFIDKVSGGSRSVPGNRALRFERGYRCDVSRDVSS